MLWIIIVVLIVLWLLGFFGPVVIPTLPHFGPWVHILIVIAVILIILWVLGLASAYTLGGFIHVLLVIAIIVIIVQVIKGRRG